MTIIADQSQTKTDTTVWQPVQAGLWVGRRAGEFAGMIEQKWGEGYVVTTRLGKNLGRFDSMEEAQGALR